MNSNFTPILTFQWNDTETTASGWLIINSFVNNLTGGGCLMSVYLTKEIVNKRAAHQSQKMALCDPPIGGAKAGIRFPVEDPRAFSVLMRFVTYFKPLLQATWIFAGDLSSNCSSMFVQCLQQARIQPRFSPELISRSYSLLPLPLNRVVGGYGVSEVVKTLNGISRKKYQTLPSVAIYGTDFYSLTLAFFLQSRFLAKVVAIGDSSGIIYDSDGLSMSQFVYTFLPRIKECEIFKLFQQKDIDSLLPEQCTSSGHKIMPKNLYLQNHIKEFFKTIPTFDILCLCGIDSQYQLSEQTVECLLQHHKPHAVISTINSAFGDVKHHPVEFSRLVEDDRGLIKLKEQDIQVVQECVSTIATNQLYQLSWTKKGALNKMTEIEILEACVVPIQSYLSK